MGECWCGCWLWGGVLKVGHSAFYGRLQVLSRGFYALIERLLTHLSSMAKCFSSGVFLVLGTVYLASFILLRPQVGTSAWRALKAADSAKFSASALLHPLLLVVAVDFARAIARSAVAKNQGAAWHTPALAARAKQASQRSKLHAAQWLSASRKERAQASQEARPPGYSPGRSTTRTRGCG